jgi:hypothetical protein
MEDCSVSSWRDLSGFKTPARVLVQQFLASRERWKRKYTALKEKTTKYRMELRDLRRSRDHWKSKAKELAKEIAGERRASLKQKPAIPETPSRAAIPPPR